MLGQEEVRGQEEELQNYCDLFCKTLDVPCDKQTITCTLTSHSDPKLNVTVYSAYKRDADRVATLVKTTSADDMNKLLSRHAGPGSEVPVLTRFVEVTTFTQPRRGISSDLPPLYARGGVSMVDRGGVSTLALVNIVGVAALVGVLLYGLATFKSRARSTDAAPTKERIHL